MAVAPIHGVQSCELEMDALVDSFGDLSFVHCFFFQDPFKFSSYMRSL